MAKTIENLFFYAVFAFDLLIVLQILIVSQKKIDKKILFLILAYCCLNSTVNFFQSSLPKNSEYLILVFFTIIEYLIFTLCFFLIIKSKKFPKIILLLSILFLAIVAFNYETGKLQRIDAVPIGVECIIIFLYCFYYLYEQMNIMEDSFIYNRYHFWIAMGIMIYLGGSFFIYIFTNQAHYNILSDYWFLTYVFYIIKNIFFSIGISLYTKKFKKPIQNSLRPSLN
jgi:hypothetical protein